MNDTIEDEKGVNDFIGGTRGDDGLLDKGAPENSITDGYKMVDAEDINSIPQNTIDVNNGT